MEYVGFMMTSKVYPSKAKLKTKNLDEQFAKNKQVRVSPEGRKTVQAEVAGYSIRGSWLTLHFKWIAEETITHVDPNGWFWRDKSKWERLRGPNKVTLRLPDGLGYMMGMRYASFDKFKHAHLAPYGEGTLYFVNGAGELSTRQIKKLMKPVLKER